MSKKVAFNLLDIDNVDTTNKEVFMSLSSLNKNAMSGKFRVLDFITTTVSIGAALYFYFSEGLTATTYWSLFFAGLSVALLLVNPASIVNKMLIKRQLR